MHLTLHLMCVNYSPHFLGYDSLIFMHSCHPYSCYVLNPYLYVNCIIKLDYILCRLKQKNRIDSDEIFINNEISEWQCLLQTDTTLTIQTGIECNIKKYDMLCQYFYYRKELNVKLGWYLKKHVLKKDYDQVLLRFIDCLISYRRYQAYNLIRQTRVSSTQDSSCSDTQIQIVTKLRTQSRVGWSLWNICSNCINYNPSAFPQMWSTVLDF